jgi:hypothetical protein
VSTATASPGMKTLSVKLDEDVVASARIISAATGEPINTLLSRLLRPALQELEEKALQDRERERKSKAKRPGDKETR